MRKPIVNVRTLVAAIVAGALLVGAALWLYPRMSRSSGDSTPQSVAPAQMNARELRFASGSPQLSFIKAEAVTALPEPLLDPLNARIAYDENHTVRLSSPIAGRVTRYSPSRATASLQARRSRYSIRRILQQQRPTSPSHRLICS